MSGCGARLRAELEERGYRVVATPLPSFQRSGASAFCLTRGLIEIRTGAPSNGLRSPEHAD
jgi:hypothetical protein